MVKTDLPSKEARRAAEDFERSYALFREVAFRSTDPPRGQMEVVVFSRPVDFAEIAPRRLRAYFSPGEPYFTPIIVTYGRLDENARRVFQHELTHRFIRHHTPLAPRWLNEGMAEYFSTLRFDGKKAIVGEASPCIGFWSPHLGVATALAGSEWSCDVYGWISISKVPSVARILRADAASFGDSDEPFYAGAWALVRLLANDRAGYAPRFRAYLAALVEGKRPDDAWEAAFREVRLPALQTDLRAHILGEHSRVFHVPIKALVVGRVLSETQLRSGDTHLLWTRLLLGSGKRPGPALASDLAEARQEEPDPAELSYVRGVVAGMAGDASTMRSLFEDAITRAPKDERPRYALARFLHDKNRRLPPAQQDPAAVEAAMQGLARVAQSAYTLNLVAAYRAERAECDIGLPFARRAIEREPWCGECYDTRALLAFETGSIDEALQFQERAVELMPEGKVPPDMMARLKKYREAAAAKGWRPAEERFGE